MSASESNAGAHEALVTGGQSPRDRLKALAHDGVEPLDLDVPGYGGALVARYRPITKGEREKVAELAARDETVGNVRVILDACEGIYVRDGDDLTPVLGEDGASHARFDGNLAWYLDLDVRTDDDLVHAVIKGGAVAIGRHAALILAWMADPSGKRARAALGG